MQNKFWLHFGHAELASWSTSLHSHQCDPTVGLCLEPSGGPQGEGRLLGRGGGNLFLVSLSEAQNAVWFRGLTENGWKSLFGFRTSPKNREKKTPLLLGARITQTPRPCAGINDYKGTWRIRKDPPP